MAKVKVIYAKREFAGALRRGLSVKEQSAVIPS